MSVEVNESKIFIGGEELKNYEFQKEIGRGANGQVYLVKNLTLDRGEALKIWVKRKVTDKRDKIEQGIAEVKKLARVNGNHAIQIYSAEEFNGFLIATMEYFEAETLNNFILDKTNSQICVTLRRYLYAIEQTSFPETFHGDAHEKNILVREVMTDYKKDIELKLCDFGTSIFNGRISSFERHWRIVRETILNCTKGMERFDYAFQFLQELERSYDTANEQLEEIKKGNYQFYDPRIFTAPYKDYLEIFEF